MLFFPGKIVPFIRIGLHVIEFFATTGVMDVPPSIIAQSKTPCSLKMGKRDVWPVSAWVRKQRYEAGSIVSLLRRQST